MMTTPQRSQSKNERARASALALLLAALLFATAARAGDLPAGGGYRHAALIAGEGGGGLSSELPASASFTTATVVTQTAGAPDIGARGPLGFVYTLEGRPSRPTITTVGLLSGAGVQGRADAGNTVTVFAAADAGLPGAPLATGTSDATGSYGATGAPLGNGAHRLVVVAQDGRGFRSEPSEVYQVSLLVTKGISRAQVTGHGGASTSAVRIDGATELPWLIAVNSGEPSRVSLWIKTEGHAVAPTISLTWPGGTPSASAGFIRSEGEWDLYEYVASGTEWTAFGAARPDDTNAVLTLTVQTTNGTGATYVDDVWVER